MLRIESRFRVNQKHPWTAPGGPRLLQPDEFRRALQDPIRYFADPVLQRCRATIQMGVPWLAGGGACGAVAQMTAPDGTRYGVKAFVKVATEDMLRHLPSVGAKLAELRLACLIDYEFQREGILFGGHGYPCVRMPWVEKSLLYFLEQARGNSAKTGHSLGELATILRGVTNSRLERVLHRWFAAVGLLHRYGIAPSDIHHENVRLTEDDQIRIIDLEGIYVPGINRASIGEAGMHGYCHPMRSSAEYSSHLLDFPAWVILHALTVAVADPELSNKLFRPDDDRLILSQEDLNAPGTSQAFALLLDSTSEAVRVVTKLLASFCACEFEHVPPLTEAALGIAVKLPIWRPVSRSTRSRVWRPERVFGARTAQPSSCLGAALPSDRALAAKRVGWWRQFLRHCWRSLT